MFTIFASPKPFLGHINLIQRNAIKSWHLLDPSVEIILFGNEEGTAEVAKEFNLKHIPVIPCNEFGTPLINGIFNLAEKNAKYDILCYINADIILTKNFHKAISVLSEIKKAFLLIGQRWDVDIYEEIDFQKDWEKKLVNFVQKNGVLHSKTGIDYFVYYRGSLPKIPPFAIGRPAWDSWLVYHSRKKKIKVIDGTQYIFTIHQNHDYSHVKERTGKNWEGPEANNNRNLLGCNYIPFNVGNANYFLTKDLKLKVALNNQIKTFLNVLLKTSIMHFRYYKPKNFQKNKCR